MDGQQPSVHEKLEALLEKRKSVETQIRDKILSYIRDSERKDFEAQVIQSTPYLWLYSPRAAMRNTTLSRHRREVGFGVETDLSKQDTLQQIFTEIIEESDKTEVLQLSDLQNKLYRLQKLKSLIDDAITKDQALNTESFCPWRWRPSGKFHAALMECKHVLSEYLEKDYQEFEGFLLDSSVLDKGCERPVAHKR